MIRDYHPHQKFPSSHPTGSRAHFSLFQFICRIRFTDTVYLQIYAVYDRNKKLLVTMIGFCLAEKTSTLLLLGLGNPASKILRHYRLY
jgi:hypothetical protein